MTSTTSLEEKTDEQTGPPNGKNWWPNPYEHPEKLHQNSGPMAHPNKLFTHNKTIVRNGKLFTYETTTEVLNCITLGKNSSLYKYDSDDDQHHACDRKLDNEYLKHSKYLKQ